MKSMKNNDISDDAILLNLNSIDTKRIEQLERLEKDDCDKGSNDAFNGLPNRLPCKNQKQKHENVKKNHPLKGIRLFTIVPLSSRLYTRKVPITASFMKEILKQKVFGFELKNVVEGNIFRNVLNFDIIFELLAESETVKRHKNLEKQKHYNVSSIQTDDVAVCILLEIGKKIRLYNKKEIKISALAKNLMITLMKQQSLRKNCLIL